MGFEPHTLPYKRHLGVEVEEEKVKEEEKENQEQEEDQEKIIRKNRGEHNPNKLCLIIKW